MPKNDLRINDKTWRRKRLFHERRTWPALRTAIAFLLVVALVVLGWWLELPPFDVSSVGLS